MNETLFLFWLNAKNRIFIKQANTEFWLNYYHVMNNHVTIGPMFQEDFLARKLQVVWLLIDY